MGGYSASKRKNNKGKVRKMDFHRFDEQAAYESTFGGLVWVEAKPYMDGPQGRIPVTLAAAERYCRERENAFGGGYHDPSLVLQNVKETAYWSAVKVIEDLTAKGHGALLPVNNEDEAI